MRLTIRQRKGLAVAAIVLTALAVRLAYWSQIRYTPLDVWHLWDQTDMATYLAQAQRFAAGDWLGRDPYHPYHSWQRSAGTEEDWLRWYPPGTFHQAPLYSYVLACVSKLADDVVGTVKLLQILLGSLTCVLVAAIARRTAGDLAGLIAGLAAAFYAPLFYLEPQILREGPALFGFVLLLWLLIERTREDAGGRSFWWRSPVAIGAWVGISAMFYEVGAVLAAGALIVVAGGAARRSRRDALAAAGGVVLGMALGFSPLAARNLLVGAPPLATSSRLGVNLAYANMAGVAGEGLVFAEPGPELKRILDAARGSNTAILREVWSGYEGRRGELPRRVARRFAAVWSDVEIPDNTAFAFYRREVPLLREAPTFSWIFAPAVAAWALAGLDALRRRRPASGASGERLPLGPADRGPGGAGQPHLILGVFLLFVSLALTAVLPQARYRLFVVPPLLVYAASLAATLWRWIRERRVLPFAIASLAVAVIVSIQISASAPLRRLVDRPIDYIVAGRIALAAGDPSGSIAYLRDGVEAHPGETRLRLELAGALVQAGQPAEAERQILAALDREPESEEARAALDRLRRRDEASSLPK